MKKIKVVLLLLSSRTLGTRTLLKSAPQVRMRATKRPSLSASSCPNSNAMKCIPINGIPTKPNKNVRVK